MNKAGTQMGRGGEAGPERRARFTSLHFVSFRFILHLFFLLFLRLLLQFASRSADALIVVALARCCSFMSLRSEQMASNGAQCLRGAGAVLPCFRLCPAQPLPVRVPAVSSVARPPVGLGAGPCLLRLSCSLRAVCRVSPAAPGRG
jgi:hypothetical protein